MPADRIWTFYPIAGGVDDDTHRTVWVELRPNAPITVAERIRQKVVSRAHGGGLVRVSVNEAVVTTTVRARWFEDVSIESFFVDEQGRAWHVNGWQEVGRRHYLDLSVTAYSTGLPARDPAEFVAPAGWTLTLRGTTTPVTMLSGISVHFGDFATVAGFSVLIPEPGWTAGAGLTRGPWPVEGPNGVDGTMQVVGAGDDAALALAANLAAGERWPPRPWMLRLSDGLSSRDVGSEVRLRSAS